MEKKTMRTFFEVCGRVICCRGDVACDEFVSEILELMLKISGRPELHTACMDIWQKTCALQTVADCTLLGAEKLPVADWYRCYLDMKARRLYAYDVQTVQTFDRELLMADNLREALAGDPSALSLQACYDWLTGQRDRALRCWTILAYAGDSFALDALVYAFGCMEDAENQERWQTARRLCKQADQLLTVTVPKAQGDEANRKGVEMAQVILAVRGRCAENNSKRLPMTMLQYVIDSADAPEQKIRNLYQPLEPYCAMITNERRREDRKYGF